MRSILITQDDIEAENDDIFFCKLRHPKTEAPALYLVNRQASTVCEVLKHHEKYRSWFIESNVQSDGSFYVSTPVDIVYLILVYLVKASEKNDKFSPLDQIVADDSDEFRTANLLSEFSGVSELKHVADVKEVDSCKYYRYNEENTLLWLEKKITRLSDYLKTCPDINVSLTSHNVSFIRSKRADESSEDDYLRYAHGLISDYISVELSEKVKKHLNIKDVIHEIPKAEKTPDKKKMKFSGKCEPLQDYSVGITNITNKPKKMTVSQKKLSKVDKKGIKAISSFFTKAK